LAAAEFLAVDWGTTNRRVYAIGADGAVLATERDDRGVLAVERGAFPSEAAAIRARFGDVPMLCAGMVGSTRGWVEAPYLPCPAGLAALAAGLHWIDERTAIVPGLSVIDGKRGDVMRGEEIQLLGAVTAALAPHDALLCQPGTHCKWARMDDGRVASFRTTMTGELFAMLGKHSLLADFMHGAVHDGAAFGAGLDAAADGALLSPLFGARAGVLLGRMVQEDVAAYVSGLLIGSDVREQKLVRGEQVHILADPELGRLYATAITQAGGATKVIDSHAAFVAGIAAIWKEHHALA
jgi:2-dehydro-3-deoxygalactonokinase